MAELYTNAAQTTLPATINWNQTSLTVASATKFPGSGDFRILVDDELMLVTAVTGELFTVTRAIELTDAVPHLEGATVTHILTAVGYTTGISDRVTTHRSDPDAHHDEVHGNEAHDEVYLSSDGIATHSADTTAIHGIVDTSALETTTGSQAKVDTHTGDATAAHAATSTSFTPAGSLGSTNVQDAIEEVLAEAGGGGGGAPTDATYLTATANAGLSAEIAVGATPGGELGGTWAVPTVDALHAGETHATVQGAAEATAQGALDTHEADTSAHGVDIADFETATGSQAKVDTHSADTTAVHGVANTAALETITGAAAQVATHTADTLAAHAGSAVSFVPVPGVTAVNVQDAIAQIAGVTPPTVNSAPVVDAGPGQTFQFPHTVTLQATVTDDGLPNPPAALTYLWTQTGGSPGVATFTAPTSKTTNVNFNQAGNYTLRITASDSSLTAFDEVVVVQTIATNLAPVVNAGGDQSAVQPTTATLIGSAVDDGLPSPPAAMTHQWSKISGPGGVTFGSATALTTTATFTLAGVYVLRLTSSDSALAGFDEIQVTRTAPANVAPVVNAGVDQTIVFGGTATLSATATDDGLPNPPAALTRLWEKVSGPGTITFTQPTSNTTNATFSAAGTYVIRFTASDSIASTSDTVQVIMSAAPTGFNNVITGQVAGFTVPVGENWKISGLVTSTQNVVVNGTLTMRANDTLRFININESAFVGGSRNAADGTANHEPVASDVGLWVRTSGRLDVQGTTKLAWTRLTTALVAGQTTFTLPEDPIGWQLGDELVITPTDGSSFTPLYDERTIAGINGRVITVSALSFPHPIVPIPGQPLGAEVLNLTRDCIIEGTPGGKTHVFIAGHTQQVNIDYVRIRHFGSRIDLIGRYGLHFHHADDAMSGFVAEGVVVSDGNSHAYTTHASNNIRLKNCIAHRTGRSQFWWDPDLIVSQGVPLSQGNSSDFSFYEHCAASLRVNTGNGQAEFDGRSSGIEISAGLGNAMSDCVAVGGAPGGLESAGMVWPEQGGSAEWDFQGTSVVHHNCQMGMFVWENTGSIRHPDHILVYRNEIRGLEHGAYLNNYHWSDIKIYEEAGAQMLLEALSQIAENAPESQSSIVSFQDCLFDAGRGITAVVVGEHRLQSELPVRFLRCTFRVQNTNVPTHPAFTKTYHGEGGDITVKTLDAIDLVNCTWDVNASRPHIYIGDSHPATKWRIQDSLHGTIQLTPQSAGNPGGATLNSDWGAYVKTIANFYPYAYGPL